MESTVALSLLSQHLNRVKVPTASDKVYKDECVYSFDTPDTETGLYVCLQTHLGVGRDYLEYHYKKTGSSIYLHHKRDKFEVEEPQGDGPERKVTRLAIGVEGGFDPENKTVELNEQYSLVVLPDMVSVPWPNDALPLLVTNAVQAILDAESAVKKAEKAVMAGTWDGEFRAPSKHASNLPQLNNGVRVPRGGWKCSQCELTTNLWLNLTDGSINCGRSFFDGTGGNEHALQHYRKTGYPLAVKLGTITKEGKGDVYSYDEDEMVEDPLLTQHLNHFGIDVKEMEKTDKSMVELELDLNQKFGEWSMMQEASSQLKPIHGPGYTGLSNMGNSCYLNSVMQVIFSIPDFTNKYFNGAQSIFDAVHGDPADDFNAQMAKLGIGLLSGKYSNLGYERDGKKKIVPHIAPQMFKNIIGKSNPVFMTKNQQDAQEFLLHLITMVQRHSRGNSDPTECFKIKIEDRFQCEASGKVKYSTRTEYCLPLPISIAYAENLPEMQAYEEKKASGQKLDPNEMVRPKIKLSSCLNSFAEVDTVQQFYSSAINGKTTAKKTTRLATFPDFLVIHMKKFTLGENFVPVKLDVAIEMPDELDLSSLRGHGLQPGEELLPEISEPPKMPVLNQDFINSLVDMGFPLEAAKKAVFFTDNQGLEQATNWVVEHITDNDITDPFVPPGTEKGLTKGGFVPNEEAVGTITAMGFTRPQACKALKATDNNIERAVDWIFSHSAELDKDDSEAAPQSHEAEFRDGVPKYKLLAFISHMGTSTMVGHYVCHILKDNHWVIFNDEKVALSENPPKDLAYLYLYQRQT